ncbi:choice-of-anchor D domain-containing protein, partial [Ideonella sp.]|uniref:choice-of-anchor D domain-containing protein n=1 Tax=Ideonella sp. TaxID=1929293 RepID=UPI003BB6290C
MTHATPSLSAWALGLALLLPASAWSADPTVGATRFSQNCTACHSVASTANTDRGRNAPAMIRNAINTVGAMGGFSSFTDAELEDIAAYLGNTPASLSFSATTVGQTSTSQVVTVRASRTAALNSLSASVSGDYVLQGGTCGTSLAARGSCTVGVAFAPGAAGSRSGSLNISHSGLTTPVVIALSGSATAA